MRSVAAFIAKVRKGGRRFEIAVVKALVLREEIEDAVVIIRLKTEIAVQIEHIAVQTGDGKMRLPDRIHAAFAIKEMLGDRLKRPAQLGQSGIALDVGKQDQRPERRFIVRSIMLELRIILIVRAELIPASVLILKREDSLYKF